MHNNNKKERKKEEKKKKKGLGNLILLKTQNLNKWTLPSKQAATIRKSNLAPILPTHVERQGHIHLHLCQS